VFVVHCLFKSHSSVLCFRKIKGGFPQLRTVPSRSVTKGEATRLIDVATKILVATVSFSISWSNFSKFT